MWGNITVVVGAAIQKVQKIQNDIETQLDAAVGLEGASGASLLDNDVSSKDIGDRGDKGSIDHEPSEHGVLKDEFQHKEESKDVDDGIKKLELGACEILTPNNSKSSQRKLPKPAVIVSESGDGGETKNIDLTAYVPMAKHEAALKDIKSKAIEKMKLQESQCNEEKKLLRDEMQRSKKLLEEELRDVKLSFEKERSELEVANLKLQQQLDSLQKQLDLQVDIQNSRYQQQLYNLELENKEKMDFNLKGQPTNSPDSSMAHTSTKVEVLEFMVEELTAKLKQHEVESTQELNVLSLEVHNYKSQLQNSELRMQDLMAQIKTLNETQQNLLDDSNKMKEIIRERERALEASVEQGSEIRRLQEESRQKIIDLKSELADKDARLRSFQNSVADDNDLKKEVIHYQEILKERDIRLAGFEEEGRSLAKKQSEMEKNVRKTKQELREKENEIAKLKESKDQLMKAIEQTQDALKKNELEALNTSKTLIAMQAVSQASADKLSRLEADIGAKNEELNSQRRALENAWNDNNELKRVVAELKAERDDMKRQLGEGTSKALETETTRREIEQREAVLRATSRQLQESLQVQMKESASREERLRDEIHELRRKWQEAVSSRESLTSELGQATAPLLRQISSLQETLRIKSEQWQSIESALSERALRAENAMETFEHKRSLLEDQILNLKQQLSITSNRLQDYQNQLHTTEASLDRYKRFEISWSEEKHEWESKLSLEVAQKHSLQTSLRELEMRHKLDLQNVIDKNSTSLAAKDLEIAKLLKDIDSLQREMKDERSFKGKKIKVEVSKNESIVKDIESYSTLTQTLPSMIFIHFSIHNTHIIFLFIFLLGGEVSFVATEKLNLKNRQKDEEVAGLQSQLNQLQVIN
jgi:hypothetical protein